MVVYEKEQVFVSWLRFRIPSFKKRTGGRGGDTKHQYIYIYIYIHIYMSYISVNGVEASGPTLGNTTSAK